MEHSSVTSVLLTIGIPVAVILITSAGIFYGWWRAVAFDAKYHGSEAVGKSIKTPLKAVVTLAITSLLVSAVSHLW